MLASMFITGGLDAMRHPETKVASAQPVTDQLRSWVPSLPEDTAMLVKVNGLVQVGAGVLLALGKMRRLAALALIGSVIPTTFAGHRFWEESDEKKRAQQRVHFFKNLGLLGGLILAMVDTEGAPSIGWRARRGVHQVSHAVAIGRASTGSGAHQVSAKASAAGRRTARHANEHAHHAAKAALESAEGSAHRAAAKAGATGRKARRKAGKAAARANKATLRGGHRANRVLADAATSGVALAAPYVHHAQESVQGVAKALLEGAEPALAALREGVDPLLAAGMERAEDVRAKVIEHRDH
jgi:putative oxidoreductase